LTLIDLDRLVELWIEYSTRSWVGTGAQQESGAEEHTACFLWEFHAAEAGFSRGFY